MSSAATLATRLQRTDIVALCALVVFLGFVFLNLDLGWLPNDDGTMAHEAQRVLDGESPHLDFDVPYTGGLSYLNAGAMRLFGENLLSMRYPFYVLLVVWVFVTFAIMRRFLPALLAAGSVIGTVLASVFLHMSPMPTWYNLFLGTLSLAATLQYAKSRNRAWLLLAGLLLGFSLLAKTTGAYFGLAVGYVLIQAHVKADSHLSEKIVARVALVVSVVSVVVLVASAGSISRFLGLVVPVALVAWAVHTTTRVERPSTDPPSNRLGLLKAFSVVMLGVLVPVAGFVGFLALAGGGVQTMLESVFLVPTLVVAELARDLPWPIFLAVPLGIGIVLFRLSQEDGLSEWVVWCVLVLGAGAWYAIDPRSLLLVLHTSAIWLPALVAIFYVRTLKRRSSADPRTLALLALVAGSVAFQLVRFPASNQYYTVYAFPLAALAAVAHSGWAAPRVQRTVVVALLVFGAVFGFAKLNGSIFASNLVGTPIRYVPLSMSRGGLRVPSVFNYYNEFIPLVSAAVARGETVLAGPDSPDIYFLAGAHNETPTIFDYLSKAKDPSYSFANAYVETRPGVVALNGLPVSSDVPEKAAAVLANDCENESIHGPIRLYTNCQP